jgi:phosphatidylserine/phosphatidylglycerophosphate/cardiolipin synthase-like enzyme
LLPTTDAELNTAVATGVAWVLGRASLPLVHGSWSPVVSGVDLDPRSYPRLTGETVVALIGQARHELLIATAYVDARGARALLPSLTAAAARGVAIEFAAVERLAREGAIDLIERELAASKATVDIRRLDDLAGFPHVKVLVRDRERAYLGSANFTFSGMTSNFELGALVAGEDVKLVHEFVRDLIDRRTKQARYSSDT